MGNKYKFKCYISIVRTITIKIMIVLYGTIFLILLPEELAGLTGESKALLLNIYVIIYSTLYWFLPKNKILLILKVKQNSQIPLLD